MKLDLAERERDDSRLIANVCIPVAVVVVVVSSLCGTLDTSAEQLPFLGF